MTPSTQAEEHASSEPALAIEVEPLESGLPQEQDALVAFARSTSGTYAERYAAILPVALHRYDRLLNASQLRALAGGGSLSVAQQAIAEFRQRLRQGLPHLRLPESAPLPDALAESLGAALSHWWTHAQELARQSLDEERRAMQAAREAAELARTEAIAARDQAEQRAQAALVEALADRAERDTLRAKVHDLDARLTQMSAQLASCEGELRVAMHDREHVTAVLQGLQDTHVVPLSASEMTRLAHQCMKDLKAARYAAAEALQREREVRDTFSQLEVQHRETLGQVQRAAEAAQRRQEARIEQLERELTVQREAAAAAELARARDAQTQEEMRATLAQAQVALAEARQAAQDALAAERSTAQALAAALPRIAALDKAISALRQIAVLSEYGTTGPAAGVKSGALNAQQATSLRLSISELARQTITQLGEAP